MKWDTISIFNIILRTKYISKSFLLNELKHTNVNFYRNLKLKHKLKFKTKHNLEFKLKHRLEFKVKHKLTFKLEFKTKTWTKT